MPTIREILIEAERSLAAAGIADHAHEARSLLARALKRDKVFLFAHPEYELSEPESGRFKEFVERRANHEPFQYIAGVQEFYGLDFIVTPDVLIPRPETEMLVTEAIAVLDNSEMPRFCEIGVGSGCIAVSILHRVQNAFGVGVDISSAALAIAGQNSKAHNTDERLRLEASDVFSAIRDAKFDLIVSNPPYVPVDDLAGLQAEVRNFEPHSALTDGADGLEIIRRIINAAPNYLMPSGVLLMEIGFNQAAATMELFDRQFWESVEVEADFQGIPRMVKAISAN